MPPSARRDLMITTKSDTETPHSPAPTTSSWYFVIHSIGAVFFPIAVEKDPDQIGSRYHPNHPFFGVANEHALHTVLLHQLDDIVDELIRRCAHHIPHHVVFHGIFGSLQFTVVSKMAKQYLERLPKIMRGMMGGGRRDHAENRLR